MSSLVLLHLNSPAMQCLHYMRSSEILLYKLGGVCLQRLRLQAWPTGAGYICAGFAAL